MAKPLTIDEIKSMLLLMEVAVYEEHKVCSWEKSGINADGTERIVRTYNTDTYIVHMHKTLKHGIHFIGGVSGKTHSKDCVRAWNVAYKRLLNDINRIQQQAVST